MIMIRTYRETVHILINKEISSLDWILIGVAVWLSFYVTYMQCGYHIELSINFDS